MGLPTARLQATPRRVSLWLSTTAWHRTSLSQFGIFCAGSKCRATARRRAILDHHVVLLELSRNGHHEAAFRMASHARVSILGINDGTGHVHDHLGTLGHLCA